jgi:hypothetical protein
MRELAHAPLAYRSMDLSRFDRATNPEEIDIRPRYIQSDTSNYIWPFGAKYGGKCVHEIDKGYASWAVKTIRPDTQKVSLALNYLQLRFYFD